MVNIALGNAGVADCGAGDVNHDGQITVDEILTAVDNALNGCPPISVSVVDEPHTAPPVFGAGAGFFLNNPFVLTDTIVVLDVRDGSRLPTVLNVDYVLSQEGSLTKIIPLPSSPSTHPDDPLEVSYTFNV